MQHITSTRRRLLVLIVLLAIVATACASTTQPTTPAPTTTSIPTTTTTTTTTNPVVSTTVAGSPPTSFAPPPTVDCETDVSTAEQLMVANPVDSLDEAQLDELSVILDSVLTNCRTDFVERWSIQTYMPWTRGVSITRNEVPFDLDDWPQSWRDQRSTGTPGNNESPSTTSPPTATTP